MKAQLRKHTAHLVSHSPLFLLTSLCLLLIVLVLLDIDVREGLKGKPFLVSPVEFTNAAAYPLIPSPIDPEISAKAALVMDNASKVVIYGKNPTLRFSLASTTKIMTALVGLEHYRMDQVLTVRSTFREGAVVGLLAGQKLTFENMLYAMLLPSGNDAATAIAENYPGGKEAFIARMNQKAQEWHLVDTSFSDATGLSDIGDYTTPLDLARLSSIAMEHPVFSRVVATKERVITTIDGKRFPVGNLNKLLGSQGINGIKTGFTDEAGEVLVTSRVVGDPAAGRSIIIVVMKSDDRFRDTQILDNTIVKYVTYHESSELASR